MRASASVSLMALATTTTRCVERTIHCSDGITLAAKCWEAASSSAVASSARASASAAVAAVGSSSSAQQQPSGGTRSSRSAGSSPASGGARSSGPTSSSVAAPLRRKILCLHGWLDNAASFDILAPALSAHFSSSSAAAAHSSSSSSAAATTEIVALDLPGHGLSTHKSSDGPPQLLAEYCYYVSESIDALWGEHDGNDQGSDDDATPKQQRGQEQEQELILIGHSMGAGIATTFCAAFPERVDRVVLLEGAGPLARNAADAARHVRDAVVRRRRGNGLLYGNDEEEEEVKEEEEPNNGNNGMNGNSRNGGRRTKNRGAARVYPSLDAAVEVRMSTARLSPGRQYISREGAEAMVRRATMPAPVPESPEAASNDDGGGGGGPVVFRHDPRLQWPSLQYFTREQVDALYGEVKCPACLLTAEEGWPTDARAKRSVEELLRPTHHRVLGGSHHFHADPDAAGPVVEEVLAFLERGDGGIE